MNTDEIAKLKESFSAITAESLSNFLKIELFDNIIDCREYIEQIERRNAKLERLQRDVKYYFVNNTLLHLPYSGPMRDALAELEKDNP